MLNHQTKIQNKTGKYVIREQESGEGMSNFDVGECARIEQKLLCLWTKSARRAEENAMATGVCVFMRGV